MNEITMNGDIYVKKSEIKNQELSVNTDGLPYVLIRADRAGVFVGYLKEKEGTTVTLLDCRRLWYWDGASSISEIAVYGVAKPENCKFPIAVAEAEISGVIEILKMTEEARINISEVSVWTQN